MDSVQVLANEAARMRRQIREKGEKPNLKEIVSRLISHKTSSTSQFRQLFSDVMSEMTRRSQIAAAEKKRQKMEETEAPKTQRKPSPEDLARAEMIRDAFKRQANEREVPRSTWDPNHPENSP